MKRTHTTLTHEPTCHNDPPQSLLFDLELHQRSDDDQVDEHQAMKREEDSKEGLADGGVAIGEDGDGITRTI